VLDEASPSVLPDGLSPGFLFLLLLEDDFVFNLLLLLPTLFCTFTPPSGLE